MKIQKAFFVALGCVSLGIGAVGAVLPLLPTFPFLLLAAFCFAKSSEKLHNWFTSTKLYQENLDDFMQGRGMTKRTKLRIMATVTALMAFGFAVMGRVPVGRVILVAVWVFHVVYFCFGIKTIEEDEAEQN